MKRVLLACVAVVFLFGISSVSFAAGMGEDTKDKAGTTKDEGMKSSHEGMGDMKGKGETMSSDAKDKTMPDTIESQGKTKKGKAATTKKKPVQK